MSVEIHLTTVHPRADVRIFVKQCRSLARHRARTMHLLVADSLGDAEVDGVQITDLGRAGGGRAGRFVAGSWRAMKAIRRLHGDVIHFHDPELLPLALFLRMLGHCVVYDVHEDMPRQILAKHWIPPGIRQLVAAMVGAVEWLGGRSFDAIVAATPTIAARFPPRKTVLVQNFPIIDELARDRLLPQAGRRRSFVYIGVIASIRGANEIVDAIGRLPGESRANLTLAGNFSPPGVRRDLEKLEGWQRVDYQGWLGRPEISALLSSARAGLVTLHPTRNYPDAYPVKMFEYMAAGLPVIASDFPLWRRIIEEAGCGLLVDPLSPDAIAVAMQWVLDHPADADDMGRRGRDAVLQRFNWDHEAAKLLDLYIRLSDGEHTR